MKSSNTTDTYTVKANEDGHSKGFQVYCVVMDSSGNSVESNVATLTVGEPAQTLAIVSQPQSVTVPNGEKASFTVAAQGEGLTFSGITTI